MSRDSKRRPSKQSSVDVIEIGGTTWTVPDANLPPMRESEEHTCPDCGEPLVEVQVGGEWIHSARCADCRKARDEAAFVRRTLEANARRSQLYAKMLSNFETPEPHQQRGLIAARQFVETVQERAAALVLWSRGYGTGKTHLVSGVARAAQSNGLTVTSWIEPELFARIRDSYNGNGASERRLIRSAVTSDLLVIDDLGRAYVTDDKLSWYQEKIYRIINACYQRGVSLALTTNCKPADLRDRIGGAAFSRLWEMTEQGARVIDLNGEDWRFRE